MAQEEIEREFKLEKKLSNRLWEKCKRGEGKHLPAGVGLTYSTTCLGCVIELLDEFQKKLDAYEQFVKFMESIQSSPLSIGEKELALELDKLKEMRHGQDSSVSQESNCS